MAIVLDGYLVSAPTFLAAIPGRGSILGFGSARLDRIVRAFNQKK